LGLEGSTVFPDEIALIIISPFTLAPFLGFENRFESYPTAGLATAVKCTGGSQNVDASLRQYKILLSHVDQDYTLCIKATTTDGRITTPECQNYIASLVSNKILYCRNEASTF
jgi:hypothetical protein